MITKYNIYKINEGITVSNNDIVDIIKSLETKDNKNYNLINKLINHKDNQGKTVLMNIVQSNNEDLINYILKFKPDLNAVTKQGENVLFFCKNAKIFNKFYDLGVNVHLKNNYKRNILNHISHKKIFNEALYQKLIDDGVNINENDISNGTVLNGSILNKNIVKLLIRNGVNLNDQKNQYGYLETLLREYRFYIKNRKKVIDIFKILFENNIKIIDYDSFLDNVKEIYSTYYIDNKQAFLDLVKIFKKIISPDFKIDMFKHLVSKTYGEASANIAKMILKDDLYDTEFYLYVKRYFTPNFNKYFNDFIKEHPILEDSVKYNL